MIAAGRLKSPDARERLLDLAPRGFGEPLLGGDRIADLDPLEIESRLDAGGERVLLEEGVHLPEETAAASLSGK